MRILISGGGTGGHINPALAIANMYRDENRDNIIEYVGTKRGLETKLVPKEGFKIHYVDVEGFKRKLTLDNIKTAIKAITSVGEAKRIIKNFAPDVVIGTGGYVCWPVLKAAARMGIPTLIHEQNAFPGLTVKKLAPLVKKVLISYRESVKHFRNTENLVLTGNPINPLILKLDKNTERKHEAILQDETVVLSFGGSLGAGKINENVFSLIEGFIQNSDIRYFHATGAREWERYKEKYLAIGFIETEEKKLTKGKITVSEYIYDMPQKLALSDIVICRAGAITLSELAAAKKASIIIPSPNVTNNHQYKNAKVLSDASACLMLEENALTPESLEKAIKSLCEAEKREKIQNNISNFAICDSLSRIHEAVREAMRK